MSKELAALVAKRFIQRRDVKAIQLDRPGGALKAGDWFPDLKVNAERNPNSPHFPLGFNMSHMMAHIAGTRTYGHYLLDHDDMCRVFVFDIDLNETGNWVKVPNWSEIPEGASEKKIQKLMVVTDGVNPRELWHDRRAVEARNWYKYQMKTLGSKLLGVIQKDLELPCAIAYSGSKGIHVYGFTGPMPAAEVREAAMLALDITEEFEPLRGRNFLVHKNDDPHHGFKSNFSVEVFPKQDSLEGKDLGNLVRLPLGKNHKNPKDPTFFLDMKVPLGVFKPHDNPIELLETGNPYV